MRPTLRLSLAVAAAAFVLAPVTGAPAASATPTCNGKTATLFVSPTNSSGQVIVGTAGDDVIVGGNGNDVIDGGGGNDTICGLGGDDKIRGGAGNDYLFGGKGDDDVGGQAGDDEVVGGEGNDRLQGGAGNDVLRGGDGNDILNGGEGDDELHGGANDDVLAGGDGTDSCDGGAGTSDRATLNSGCEGASSATESSSIPGTTFDALVVRAAEAEGTSWADGAAVDPANEGNPAEKLVSTDANTTGDVVGGNVTPAGDQ